MAAEGIDRSGAQGEIERGVCGEGAQKARGWISLTALFLAGHAIVLAVGWAGLASFLSPGPAFESGVLPFLPGAVAKSIAAALTVRLLSR